MFKMKFLCERNHYKKKFWNVLKRLFFKTKTFYFIKLIFFLLYKFIFRKNKITSALLKIQGNLYRKSFL